MRYCSNCGSEYLDTATQCSDCPEARLVSAEELRREGKVPLTELDIRRLVPVAQVEDPFTSDALVAALRAEGIPVLERAPRSGVVDSLTTGVVDPWWELRVPRAHSARAVRIIESAGRRLEAQRKDAEAAAEIEYDRPARSVEDDERQAEEAESHPAL